jgi:hypothetical protein
VFTVTLNLVASVASRPPRTSYAFIAAAMLIVLISSSVNAGTRPVHVVVLGRVIDDKASQPIEDALVIATWTRTWSGFHNTGSQCFYVAAGRSKSDGSFEIRATLPRLKGVSEKIKPDVFVYKPGYQLSLSPQRLRERPVHPSNVEPIAKSSIFLPALEKMWPDREPVRYLVPSTLNRTDRLRYLRNLAHSTACYFADESEKNALDFLHAIRDEASAKVVTNYDRYLVRVIERRIEEAKGDKTALWPERPFPSVFSAAQRVDQHGPAVLQKVLGMPGSDPNERGDGDRTALMIATAYSLPDHVKILLDAGADPNAKSWETGESALHLAVGGVLAYRNSPERYPKALAVLQLLLSSENVCTDRPDISGKSPMRVAEENLPEVFAMMKAKPSSGNCAQ